MVNKSKVCLYACCILVAVIIEVINAHDSVEKGEKESEVIDEAIDSTPVDNATREEIDAGNGKYYNFNNQNTNTAHGSPGKIKRCDAEKEKYQKGLDKIKLTLIQCLAQRNADYPECTDKIALLALKKRTIEARLRLCKTELDILLEEKSDTLIDNGNCEGKNRILNSHLADLQQKNSQISNLVARHQKEFSHCGRVVMKCRATRTECRIRCVTSKAEGSSSSSSSSSFSRNYASADN